MTMVFIAMLNVSEPIYYSIGLIIIFYKYEVRVC